MLGLVILSNDKSYDKLKDVAHILTALASNISHLRESGFRAQNGASPRNIKSECQVSWLMAILIP